ncbi:MauE/DoxX family redox-associated membrane protein [Nonomuraea sp. NPDC049709]|uniref:MauE/DoxX family redox-associated membrane protein n=1 Tax=Nonomuraea sp. NPDC049709 TaxID=3154736 RepID=UPI003436EED2
MQYVVPACRVAIGVVFLVAVLGKVRGKSAFASFRVSVRGLVPLGPRASTALSGAVVLAEGCVVVLLAIPGTVRVGLVLAGTVLAGFCAGIVRAMRSGSTTPCRCFGVTGTPLGRRHLVRNAGLLALVAAGLLALVAAGLVPGSTSPHPAGVSLSVLVGAVLAVIVIFFDDLADLFAAQPRRP